MAEKSFTRRRFVKLAAGSAAVVALSPLLDKSAFAEEGAVLAGEADPTEEPLDLATDASDPGTNLLDPPLSTAEQAEDDQPEQAEQPTDEPLEPASTGFRPLGDSFPEGCYYLRPLCSNNKVIDISGASTSDGGKAILWSRHGRANQAFSFIKSGKSDEQGNGLVTILNMHSGRALDVEGNRRAAGTKVLQWVSKGSANQQWLIETDDAGKYRFRSALSTQDLPLYLDITGAQDKDGAVVEIWTGKGNTAQTFVLEDAASTPLILDGLTYTLSPADASGKVLDLPGQSKASGAAVSIWQQNGGANQKFRAEQQSDGSFAFRFLHSDMVLTLREDASGSIIVQAPAVMENEAASGAVRLSAPQRWTAVRIPGGVALCNTATGGYLTLSGSSLKTTSSLTPGRLSQAFRPTAISPLAAGRYYLFTTPAGKRLDLTGASRANGATIELWNPNETVAQVFAATAVSGEYVHLSNPLSGRFIDVSGRSTAEGTKIIQWDLNGGANQQWRLEPVGAGAYRFASALAPNSWLGAASDVSGAPLFLTHKSEKALVFAYRETELPALGLKPDAGHLVFARIGDTLKLGATPVPANASLKNLSFSSSNTAVATVDASGVVKATGWGSCTITLRAGGVSATCPVSVANKWVAVTFDDGPASYTGGLLDELKKRNATCSFFVVGSSAASSSGQALLARMAAEGHEVANHTWRHDGSAGVLLDALAQTDTVVRQATGRNTALMRPPGGSINTTTYRCGKPIIMWSIDPQDWLHRDSSYVYNQVTGTAKSGDIILLHDIHATTISAVPRILDNLRSRGFALVTVSQLLGSPAANTVYRSGSATVRTSKGAHW